MEVKTRKGSLMWALMITNLLFGVIEAFSQTPMA